MLPTAAGPSKSERVLPSFSFGKAEIEREVAEQKYLSEVPSCFLVGRTNMDSQFLGLKRF